MFQLALILAATVALGVHGYYYATLCPTHTMVIHPTVGVACKPLLASGVSNADIKFIVDKHNELRSRIATGKEFRGAPGPQPAAANMLKMRWDDELAAVAQRWASQCTAGSDRCRSVTRFKTVGQNWYYFKSTGFKLTATWAEALNNWFNVVTQFNPYALSATASTYTQLVWAETYLVGCGYALYRNSDSINVKSFYVCNYAPGGNIIGSPMYQVGKPCSKCPTNTTGRAAEGLCA